jgi:hypothetical protein
MPLNIDKRNSRPPTFAGVLEQTQADNEIGYAPPGAVIAIRVKLRVPRSRRVKILERVEEYRK